jgi:calmodulin
MENLSEQQLANYTEAFRYYDKDHDGKITTHDLGIVMRSLGKCVTQRQLREVSNSFEDGYVDLAEFLVLMETVPNIVNSADDVIECFRAFDRKKTGLISVDKLKEILMTLGEELSESEVDHLIERYCPQDQGQISYIPLAHALIAVIQ